MNNVGAVRIGGMDEDSVTVPPEVRDGLEACRDAGALQVGRREAAIEWTEERDLDATAKWLRKVDEVVYDRAAQGRFVGGDET